MSEQPTSSSLLIGLRRHDPVVWERFVRVYSPLVYEWCRRARVGAHDSADIVQEVSVAVSERIDAFRRDQPGDSFQGWLWSITRNKVVDYFRSLDRQPVATGGTDAQRALNGHADQLPEVRSREELERDRQVVLRRALNLLQTDFEERTWRAFCRLVMDGVDASSVADELGMSAGSVYNAKYKVLRRLRDEFGDMDPLPIPG